MTQNVLDDPDVVRPMPRSPEVADRIVVAHAPDHIFRWIIPVTERPKSEEAPRQEQLEPDDDQIPKSELQQLVDRETLPGLSVLDGDNVDVV